MRRIYKKSEPDHLINWKKDFKNTHGTDPTYDDLLNSPEYYRVRKELLEEQGYICCYCEKAIGRNQGVKDCNIEHFMPRHPDPRILTPDQCRRCEQAELDYDNMFASCLGEEQYSLDEYSAVAEPPNLLE